MTRIAILDDKGQIETIRRYLPSNYIAEKVGPLIVIVGEDLAGWTLDGYVLPRLASGLHFAREVVTVNP